VSTSTRTAALQVAEPRELLLEQTRMVMYLLQRLDDGNAEIVRTASLCLDACAEQDERWAAQIRQHKFAKHNQEWLDVVDEDEAEEYQDAVALNSAMQSLHLQQPLDASQLDGEDECAPPPRAEHAPAAADHPTTPPFSHTARRRYLEEGSPVPLDADEALAAMYREAAYGEEAHYGEPGEPGYPGEPAYEPGYPGDPSFGEPSYGEPSYAPAYGEPAYGDQVEYDDGGLGGQIEYEEPSFGEQVEYEEGYGDAGYPVDDMSAAQYGSEGLSMVGCTGGGASYAMAGAPYACGGGDQYDY
jgi:hypothetical protein